MRAIDLPKLLKDREISAGLLIIDAGVIAATLLSFATPATDIRVERRGAIVVDVRKIRRAANASGRCTATQRTVCTDKRENVIDN